MDNKTYDEHVMEYEKVKAIVGEGERTQKLKKRLKIMLWARIIIGLLCLLAGFFLVSGFSSFISKLLLK